MGRLTLGCRFLLHFLLNPFRRHYLLLIRGVRIGREEEPGRDSDRKKDKRRDRQRERQDDRREERREERSKAKPPTPPRSRRFDSPEHPEVTLTASAKRKAEPEQLRQVSFAPIVGKPRKTNKGRKHRERGVNYWKDRVIGRTSEKNEPHATSASASGAKARPVLPRPRVRTLRRKKPPAAAKAKAKSGESLG